MLRLLPSLLFTSLLFSSYAGCSPLSPEAANGGSRAVPAKAQGKPASEGVTTFDGVNVAAIKEKPSIAAVTAGAMGQAGWTATADSAQGGSPASSAIDGDNTTVWHTQFYPNLDQLPHTITIDMQQVSLIGSITYLPRQDGNSNGNIGQHVISFRSVPWSDDWLRTKIE